MLAEMVDSDRDLEEFLEERGLDYIDGAELYRAEYDRDETQITWVFYNATQSGARSTGQSIERALKRAEGQPADPKFHLDYIDYELEDDGLYIMAGLEHRGKRTGYGGGIAQYLD